MPLGFVHPSNMLENKILILRILVFAMVFVCASAANGQAQDLQRIALIQITGSESNSIKEALRTNLASQPGLAMVSDPELSNSARTLNLEQVDGPYTGTDLPKLAQSLGISAFIEGQVSHARRKWTLELTVRDSVGDISGQAYWSGRTLAALKVVKKDGYSKLAGYLTQAMQSSASLGSSNGASANTSVSAGGAWWQSSNEEKKTYSGPTQDFHALRINVLAGSLYRSMKTLVLTSFALSRPLEQRYYKSRAPGNMEVGLEAEFYPLALPFASLPKFPYLGIVTSFSYGLFLNGTACEVLSVPGAPCDAGDLKDIQTTQWEFLAALRGRYRFGKSRFDPEIQLDAGFGMFTFAFNMDDLLELSGLNPAAVVPPMRYRYLHVAVGGSYGLTLRI
ncbi:MAG: hypothetical protein IPJ88_07810 [Myxococcales bacterium]|nr:MAG: hypothetical protein IPJ88_07810 [Myxococcales bacterium]